MAVEFTSDDLRNYELFLERKGKLVNSQWLSLSFFIEMLDNWEITCA